MVVVAIKFKASPTPEPSSSRADSAEKKPLCELAKMRTPRANGLVMAHKIAKQDPGAQSKQANTAPFRQVVTFKCRRLTRAVDDQANEVEDGETYVYELPFAVLAAQ